MKNAWYLLRCKPGHDQRAVLLLQNQNYRVYSPRVWVDKSKSLETKRVQEPLFPGYLFIDLDVEHTNWTAVRFTRGVIDFVRFGPGPAIVDEKIVDVIRAQERSSSDPDSVKTLSPSKGDRVCIAKGCFEGLDAIYQYRCGKERVVVLINLLGSLNEAVVNLKDLKKA